MPQRQFSLHAPMTSRGEAMELTNDGRSDRGYEQRSREQRSEGRRDDRNDQRSEQRGEGRNDEGSERGNRY